MDITNQKLHPYISKVKQILSTLTDTQVSIPVRITRIPDAKKQLETLADYLIKAKDKATDVVFKSEIDYIVDVALKGFKLAAEQLANQNTNPLPEPTKSDSAKYLEELGMAGPTVVETPAFPNEYTVTPVQDYTQPQIEAPVARHFEPVKPVKEFSIDGVTSGNESGFFVFTEKGNKYFADKDALKTFLSDNYMGKNMPTIIKGELIKPQVNVSIDFNYGDPS